MKRRILQGVVDAINNAAARVERQIDLIIKLLVEGSERTSRGVVAETGHSIKRIDSILVSHDMKLGNLSTRVDKLVAGNDIGTPWANAVSVEQTRALNERVALDQRLTALEKSIAKRGHR